jgi:hypothetical protein
MDLLEQTVQRGNEARQILVNPVFVEAKQRLKDKYLADLLAAQDKDKRETLWLKIQVLEEVTSELGIIEQHGAKADHDIKTRRRRASQ